MVVSEVHDTETSKDSVVVYNQIKSDLDQMVLEGNVESFIQKQ